MRLKHVGVSGVVGLLALVVGLGQATTYGAGPPATPLVEAAKQADTAAVPPSSPRRIARRSCRRYVTDETTCRPSVAC